jgi:hypothetical protein
MDTKTIFFVVVCFIIILILIIIKYQFSWKHFIISILTGFLYSPLNFGPFLFSLIILASEFSLLNINRFKYDNVIIRFPEILGTVFGWFFGRIVFFSHPFCNQCQFNVRGENACKEHPHEKCWWKPIMKKLNL